MQTLSRHLPPAPTVPLMSRLRMCMILGICAMPFAAALYFEPIRGGMFGFLAALLLFAGMASILSKLSDRKFEKLMAARAGENICTFRRAFDLRQVDPWIIRAVHEEVCDLIGVRPLRASDHLLDDLRIDPEDVEDIAKTIAYRAGYDLNDTHTNPLFGKVFTVGELVLFFTHQRRLQYLISLRPLRRCAKRSD
jgi:hypothetical protein